jgi:hypothetical protein
MKLFVKIVVSFALLACAYASEADHHEEAHNEIVPDTGATVEKDPSSVEDRGRLITDLLKTYDKRNYPSALNVKLGVNLLKLDVDNHKGIVETDVWLKKTWVDPRLSWHPEEYGNQTVIRLPISQIWIPDITLYNDGSPAATDLCKGSNVLVYSTGKVLWVPPCNLHSHCNLTLDRHPFAEQTCELKFGSWTFDGHILDLHFYDKPELDVSEFWDVTDWELIGNTAQRKVSYYSCCTEPYVSLSYSLTFKRKGRTSGSCHH